MKAPFKYSGGKSREAKLIASLAPIFYDRVIEPFGGSAALSFYLEKPAIIGDTRLNNIFTLRAIRDHWEDIEDYIEHVKQLTIVEREAEYYIQRDNYYNYNNGINPSSTVNLVMAKRWIFLRQQCFSGMDRINKKTGKFNVPFGWYNNFTSNLTKKHSEFLKNCELYTQGYEETMKLGNENDFIFLDPPYYKRQSDYGGGYDDNAQFHIEIANQFKASKSKVMMVHIDCELYRDIYKDYNIVDKPYTYSQNFKGRENKDAKVKHLYIMNYE